MRGGNARILLPLLLPMVLWAMHGSPALAATSVGMSSAGTTRSPAPAQLVFGSFVHEHNAISFAARVSRLVSVPVAIATAGSVDDRRFRVVGPVVAGAEQAQLARQATSAGLAWWRLPDSAMRSMPDPTPDPTPDPMPTIELVAAVAPAASISASSASASSAVVAASSSAASASAPQSTLPATAALAVTVKPASTNTDRSRSRRNSRNRREFDIDVGVQNRVFAATGSNTSDQYQYSASANLHYVADFRDGLDSLRGQLFGRWDSDDNQRSHTDVRELSWTHVFAGSDSGSVWQLQAGIGQVFWGVTEFNHLIDVVNQTDLVENPDGEEKLGQPLVSLTNVRDWGTLELFVLPGFRERRFPGLDGRLALALPIDKSATRYESGAEDKRIDGVARLSTLIAGAAVDVYHFNGTRRTPRFEAGASGSQLTLVPVYDTIKRTALAAQTNVGDTAFKLEAYTQRGGPRSYWAGVLGVEHTFVGAFGGSSDLGVVVEYNYDSRGGAAFDSFLERDLALGARLAANDLHDSQALFGVVWDTTTNEKAVLLEASRRLNDRWSLELESRWFSGGDALGRFSSLSNLLDNNNKLGSLQRDDYIQLEFTRYF